MSHATAALSVDRDALASYLARAATRFDRTVPLGEATGEHRAILVSLADTYVDTSWRPCLDADTTLADWLDVTMAVRPALAPRDDRSTVPATAPTLDLLGRPSGTVTLALSAEQLETLTGALDDAYGYRESDGGCSFCDHDVATSGDENAECEDHQADTARRHQYAALESTLRDAARILL